MHTSVAFGPKWTLSDVYEPGFMSSRVLEAAQRQRQLNANLPAGVTLDEFLQRLGDLSTFGGPPRQFLGHLFRGVTRPALGRVDCHHAQRLVILAREEVADYGA